jgi:hypothetical protein
VLSRDYLGVLVELIDGIASQLTTVGGHIVYADGHYAAFEGKLR